MGQVLEDMAVADNDPSLIPIARQLKEGPKELPPMPRGLYPDDESLEFLAAFGANNGGDTDSQEDPSVEVRRVTTRQVK